MPEIRVATEEDVPLILRFIKELAIYERLSHEVSVTEELLTDSLFGERRVAEALLGYLEDDPAGFALFFHNFSTFLGKPGIYLEDLYVRPEFRGAGVGRALLVHLAKLAKERGCGRVEWSVLDWNEPAIGFYKSIGASPVGGWTVYRLSGEALEALAGREGGQVRGGSVEVTAGAAHARPVAPGILPRDPVTPGEEGNVMSEERKERSFWVRLFSLDYHSAREQRVVEYILHRLSQGASLQEIVREEYVRRNASPVEVEEICSKPELVQAAREDMQRDFSSEDLDPHQRPG